MTKKEINSREAEANLFSVLICAFLSLSANKL